MAKRDENRYPSRIMGSSDIVQFFSKEVERFRMKGERMVESIRDGQVEMVRCLAWEKQLKPI